MLRLQGGLLATAINEPTLMLIASIVHVLSNRDLDATLAFVKRAEKAGYTAVAVTVDTPFLGKRRADEKNHFFLPSHLSLVESFVTSS